MPPVQEFGHARSWTAETPFGFAGLDIDSVLVVCDLEWMGLPDVVVGAER